MRIAHSKKLENALWSAIANFEEHAALLRRLAEATSGDVSDLEAGARERQEYAAELRALIEKVNGEQTLISTSMPSSKYFNGT